MDQACANSIRQLFGNRGVGAALFCADRLAPYKVPGSVLFTDALPRTSVGKVAKAQLRTQFLPASPESPRISSQENA